MSDGEEMEEYSEEVNPRRGRSKKSTVSVSLHVGNN